MGKKEWWIWAVGEFKGSIAWRWHEDWIWIEIEGSDRAYVFCLNR